MDDKRNAQQVLGGLMLHPQYLSEIDKYNLSVSDFSSLLERYVFTAIGVISVILAIVRFVHKRRRKEWKSNVSIQDYPTDYDVEMECRNAIYSKIWTEETTVGLR